MIFPEDRRRRSNVRLSPEPKQRKRLSLLAYRGLGSSWTQTPFHHRSSRSWQSVIKKWVWWQQFLRVILETIPENKINIYFLKRNITWNCWKAKQLTASFSLSRFSLILYCPVTYRVALEAQVEHDLPQQDPSDMRTICTTLSYLNSSISLPIIDFDASVGQGWGCRGKGAAGKLWLLVSWRAAKDTCPGQAESLRRELLCFIAAWKGNILNLAPFVAPEQWGSNEKERASQALGPGIRCT